MEDTTKVSYSKPDYLLSVETTPLFMIDCDPKELELGSRIQPAIRPLPPTMVGHSEHEEPKPKEVRISASESTRPVVESKKSSTTVTKVVEKNKQESDRWKRTDILTLKKEVIEEIRNELEITGNSKKAGNYLTSIGRPGYVDPFSRFDAVQAATVQMKGRAKEQEDDEDQINVLSKKARAFAEVEHSRKSVTSVLSKNSMTES